MNVSYRKNSAEVAKAKIGHFFGSKTVVRMLGLASTVLLISSGLLLSANQQFAAVSAAGSILLLVFLIWLKGDVLQHQGNLAESQKGDSLRIHKAASRELLMAFGSHSESQLWEILQSAPVYRFIALRFGISSEFLREAIKTYNPDSNIVWVRAAEVAAERNGHEITSADLFAAFIEQVSGINELLPHLGLEPQDLYVGVRWYRRVSHLAEEYKKDKTINTLAREWSAGYTPYLSRMAHDLSAAVAKGGVVHREVGSHQQAITNAINMMAEGSRTTVALVGDVGSGKSTLVYALARQLLKPEAPTAIRGYRIFKLDATTILNQSQQASVEQVMTMLLNEAHKAGNIILFLDDASAFFSQGVGAVDASRLLEQLVQAGSVPVIMSFTPTEWQSINAKSPTITSSVNRLAMEPLSHEETVEVLEDRVIPIEYQRKQVVTFQAIKEAIRLSEHYVHESVLPGKAVSLLESSTNYAQNTFVTAQSVQQAVESSTGIKVQKAGAQEKQQLLNLEEAIHQRMVNQTRAVQVVSDALRRARSGVGNPNKPVGTFLFLGPTGVGKTELSKALSEVMFNGEQNLVRVDLNEFTQATDVSRLLASNLEGGTSLIAKVKQQPYCVVLLDEIEKAHPSVMDVLLQALDEGILRDDSNKEVSFREAVIIATSNAGAQQIREHIDRGENLEQFEEQFTNELIASGQFRPEFLNRFDEIVLFRPLNMDELLLVVDKMMAGVNQALSNQQITVQLTDEAKRWLVEQGYDARLGARPLQRVIQRTVESVVAKMLLANQVQPGQTVQLDKSHLMGPSE